MDKNLRKIFLYREIAESLEKSNFIISGKILGIKERKLHVSGGGRALYLSQEEFKDILKGSNKVKITVIEDKEGKKRIIIEPI